MPGAGDPQLTTPSVNRADIWVFNPASLGTTLGGTPVRIVTLFGDTPRALAVSPDRRTVYAAILQSGNQTTTANLEAVCDGFITFLPCFILSDRPPLFNNSFPGGLPGPRTNAEGRLAPEVGLVVKFNRSRNRWEDTLGRNWNNAIRFRLPDKDVFAINADTLAQTAFYTGVGTTLFNMVTNPVNGRVYVTNSEAQNLTRFEGPGVFGGSTVQGNLAQMRVTVISGTSVTPRHLNKHIDYSTLATEAGFDPTTKNHSLSTPLGMAVSNDGARLYIAAFGSSKIGVLNTAALENNSFNPRTASASYINVTGGGPSGIVLDEPRNRLYVMTRFDNAVKAINLTTRAQVASVTLPNPEPASVVQGRPLLYDANFSSANGEASCASCHIFGDKDELAWDLGNPDDPVTSNPIPARLASGLEIGLFQLVTTFPGALINGTGNPAEFHPMKGPMTTQTLRGLVNAGAMHWRGDRANGFFGVDTRTQPPFDANLSFNNFIVAFEGLLGRASMPTPQEMQRFTDFQLQVQLPPNPIRALDNSLNASQAAGAAFYFGARRSDGIAVGADAGFNCNGCHVVDSAQGLLRHRRPRELRRHHADLQDPAPAQHLYEDRHVRLPGLALLRRQRERQPGRSGPRLRPDQRRRRRHGRSLPERDRVPQQPARAGRRHSECADAPRPGAVRARVRHRPRADRRPADHADEHERRRGESAHRSADRAGARTVRVAGSRRRSDRVRPGREGRLRRTRTRIFLRSRERHLGPGRRQPEHCGLHAAGDGRNGRPGSDVHCCAARLRPPHRCQQLTPRQQLHHRQPSRAQVRDGFVCQSGTGILWLTFSRTA